MIKLHTTLALLNEYEACESGYKTLLKSLPADYGENTPINLLHILESNGVQDMLWCLRATIEPYKDHQRYLCEMCADFAESVLPFFESLFPGDLRPRQAIASARSGTAERAAETAAAEVARAAKAAGTAAAEVAWAAEAAGTAAAWAARTAAWAAGTAERAARTAAAWAARAAAWAAEAAARAAGTAEVARAAAEVARAAAWAAEAAERAAGTAEAVEKEKQTVIIRRYLERD